MTTGQKIKLFRTSKQISQESLASLLDISRQSVSKWEQGISLPSADNLIRLSEIFKVSVEELMNENYEISKYYKPYYYFKGVWQKRIVCLPILIFLFLFIVTFAIAVYLETLQTQQAIALFLGSLSGGFALIASMLFLGSIAYYVYQDCKHRNIRPYLYVCLSLIPLGLIFYLLRRDEITKLL